MTPAEAPSSDADASICRRKLTPSPARVYVRRCRHGRIVCSKDDSAGAATNIGFAEPVHVVYFDHALPNVLWVASAIGLSATTRFIRGVHGVTGATPDSKLVVPPLLEQREELGVVPPKVIYDRAAGSPKTFAEVSAATEGKTQLVARLIDHTKSKATFGPQDCSVDEDGFLTCPAGRKSSRAYRAQSGDGWYYRFLASDCQGCPLIDKCRRNQEKPKGNRNFFISDYVYHQRQALAYLKSEAFTQDMRLRPAIERIIACLVRYHGARRAIGYGVASADYQGHMSAMAFNLKTWVTLTRERRNPKRTRAPDDTG